MNGPPGIQRPRVLRVAAYPRIAWPGPEPLLSPLPDIISPHSPGASGGLRLGGRRRQVTARPIQPAAHWSRPLPAMAAASSRSLRIPATDKTVVPGPATLAVPRSVSSTGILAG